MKHFQLICYCLAFSLHVAAQQAIPKIVILRPTVATESPASEARTMFKLSVNDTLPVWAMIGGYYYVSANQQYGFVYSYYAKFLGNDANIDHLEVSKNALFVKGDKLNADEIKSIRKGKFVRKYQTAKVATTRPSSIAPVRSYSSTCGARTKKGGSCQRTVSGGGRCWQHGG